MKLLYLTTLLVFCIATSYSTTNWNELPFPESQLSDFPLELDEMQFVDPMSVIEGVQIGISVLDALGLLGDQDEDEVALALGQINQNLGTLIRGQKIILNELQNMQIQFRDDLRAEFIHSVEARLIAQAKHFEDYLATYETRSRKDNLERLKRMAQETVGIGYQLAEYGLAAYQATIASNNLIDSMYSHASAQVRRKGLRRELSAIWQAQRSQYAKIYNHWLSMGNPDSIVSSILFLKDETDRLLLEINNHPKKINLPMRTEQVRRGGRLVTVYEHRWARTLYIQGSVETGFWDKMVEKDLGEFYLYTEPRDLLTAEVHEDFGGTSKVSDTTILDTETYGVLAGDGGDNNSASLDSITNSFLPRNPAATTESVARRASHAKTKRLNNKLAEYAKLLDHLERQKKIKAYLEHSLALSEKAIVEN